MSYKGQELNLVNVVSATLVQLPGTVFRLICTYTKTFLKRLKNVHVYFNRALFVIFHGAPGRFVERRHTNCIVLYCTAGLVREGSLVL